MSRERQDIALDCGMPIDWIPENHIEMEEVELVLAIEANRDRAARQIKLEQSPLYMLLTGKL